MRKPKERLSKRWNEAGNIIAIVLASSLILLAMLMAGCGGDNPVKPEPPDPPDPPTHPDAVTFSALTKDERGVILKKVTITLGGKKVATGSESFSVDYGKTAVEICAVPAASEELYFKEESKQEHNCKMVMPDQDRPEIPLTLERKVGRLKVLLIFPDKNHPYIDRPPNFDQKNVIKVNGRSYDDFYNDKEAEFDPFDYVFEWNLAYRADPYMLSAVYGKARVEKGISMSDSLLYLEIKLPDLPNCSDGFDGDGDGSLDKDDTGCATDAGITMVDGEITFEYDPGDNYEVVKGHTTTYISLGREYTYISSAENHRKLLQGTSYIDEPSISVALRIGIFAKPLVEADQDGEAFAFKVVTGKNISSSFTTSIVKDDGSGGRKRFLKFVPNDFFSESQNFRVYFLHASLVRGKKPGDGKDDVIFEMNDGQKRATLGITWAYEPEDVPQPLRARAGQAGNGQDNVIVRHFENVGINFFKDR